MITSTSTTSEPDAGRERSDFAALLKREFPIEGIELNPEAIEHALYQLERATVLSGVPFSALDKDIWPDGRPNSDIGCMIVNPVSQACLWAQRALVLHLKDIVGAPAANEIYHRVSRQVFFDIERPLIQKSQTSH